MSGRGRGRSGRGGRGFTNRFNSSSQLKKENKDNKKSFNDCNYYIGSAKQASEFKATTEFLINYIKQTYKFGMDIAMAIINQEHINTENWKPPIKRIQSEDPEIKEAENEQYKIEYKLQ